MLGFSSRARALRDRLGGGCGTVRDPNAVLPGATPPISSGPVHHHVGVEKRHRGHLVAERYCIAWVSCAGAAREGRGCHSVGALLVARSDRKAATLPMDTGHPSDDHRKSSFALERVAVFTSESLASFALNTPAGAKPPVGAIVRGTA